MEMSTCTRCGGAIFRGVPGTIKWGGPICYCTSGPSQLSLDEEKDVSKEDYPLELSLGLLAAACDAGRDLYLTGSIGGFGSSFHSVHTTRDEAVEFAKDVKLTAGTFIYRLKVEPTSTFISPDGSVIEKEKSLGEMCDRFIDDGTELLKHLEKLLKGEK